MNIYQLQHGIKRTVAVESLVGRTRSTERR